MSKQLTYFLAPEDLPLLEESLRQYGFDRFLPRRFPGPNLPEIRSLTPFTPGVDPLTLFAVRSADLSKIAVEATDGAWRLNEIHSPVVEVSRCFSDAKIIRRGRIYAPMGAFEGERWIPREADFVAAVDGVFRRLRKVLKRDPNLDAYVGPAARATETHGVKLSRI